MYNMEFSYSKQYYRNREYKQTRLEQILYWLNKKYPNINYTVSETEVINDSNNYLDWPIIPLNLYYHPIKTYHID